MMRQIGFRATGMKWACGVLLGCLLFGVGCGRPVAVPGVERYDFRDTRNLLRWVYEASQVLEKDGLATMEAQFAGGGDDAGSYLYVYDMDGNCLFHGGMPELEMKNLSTVTDIDDKPILQLVHEALSDPKNPHGWIHYTWWRPGKFYPVPKSSCHFQVTLPDGREVFVGGGLDFPHEEREFVRIAVDSAVRLIEEKGEAAFDKIDDPASPYQYRDVRVFAFQPGVEMQISPVLGDTRLGMDLADCEDEVGHKPFGRAMEQLENESLSWQIFTAKSRGSRHLKKKILYLRKTELNGAPLYVGAITDLPQTP